MSNDAAIMEALLRIEHKQDQILTAFKTMFGVEFKGLQDECVCPICNKEVDINIKLGPVGHVTRKCACHSGKFPINMSDFSNPISPARRVIEEK